MTQLSDKELVEGIRTQDRRVLSHIYRTLGPKVIGYVIKNSGSEAEGKSILSQTMMKIWQNIQQDKYKEQGSFKSYFITVAVKTWLDELRRRKRKGTDSLSEQEYALADEGQDEIVRKVAQEQHLNALYKGLDKLGEECRELIEAFHLQGESLQDLAVRFEKSYSAIRKRIFDCRKKLKRHATEFLAS